MTAKSDRSAERRQREQHRRETKALADTLEQRLDENDKLRRLLAAQQEKIRSLQNMLPATAKNRRRLTVPELILLDALHNGPMSAGAAAADLPDYSPHRAARNLTTLSKIGLVTGEGKPKLWRLTAAGERVLHVPRRTPTTRP